jgi:hypothetical protein
VIFVGIDDTDIIGTPGTNQLARAILNRLGETARGAIISRHQLFFDPRVPYTSKNGSASIRLPHADPGKLDPLISVIREVMRGWFVEGSDPGLCVATGASGEVREFSLRCKTEVITQEEARSLAAREGCHLEGLGGTEQGIIGALAAIGLITTGNDGRVVHLDFWQYPDDPFSGPRSIEQILARGVHEVRQVDSDEVVASGLVDVGNHLRPNWRGSRIVLYIKPSQEAAASAPWQAVKLL